MEQASAVYRVLGDEARLRLLRVLHRERFNVTELTGILGLAQSGVSRHLRLLKDAGFVVEEREAGYTYYRLPGERTDGLAGVWQALERQFEAAADDPAVKADGARLQEVLRLRRENFDAAAAEGRGRRQMVPGRSWAAWSRALGLLLPPLRVADLGCGEGYLTIEAARWAAQVVAVDRSRAVLERARALARRRRVANVVWRHGELEKLPLKDASVDVALLSQVLHDVADPGRVVAEAARIVVPGGRLLILDLRRHEEAWVATLGHRRLGFRPEDLDELLRAAGLEACTTTVGASRTGDPFAVIIAAATKPAAQPAARASRRKKDR